MDTTDFVGPARFAAGAQTANTQEVEFCARLAKLLRTHKQWFWYPYQIRLLWGRSYTPFQTSNEAEEFHRAAESACAIEALADGRFMVKRTIIQRAQELMCREDQMGRVNPNKKQERVKLRQLAGEVARRLGAKAREGFTGKDLWPLFEQRTDVGGFISSAKAAGLIEPWREMDDTWQFSREFLRSANIVAEAPEKSDKLRQLFMVFGDKDELCLSRSAIADYFIQPVTSRVAKLSFSCAENVCAWLDKNKGENHYFFRDGDQWLFLKSIPDEWIEERKLLLGGESIAASQEDEEEQIPEIDERGCAVEDTQHEEIPMDVNSAEPKSANLLTLPPPGIREHHMRFAQKTQLIAVYNLIGSHEPVPERRWREAVVSTDPNMSDSAINSWLYRLTKVTKLVTDSFHSGNFCYNWNVDILRAFFGMPPEEVSSAAEAPASAPAPLPEDVATVQEEVPDAIVEVVQPLTEPEKAAKFAEFVVTAQPSYLEQLRTQHTEAVAAYGAQQERIEEARMQIRTWTNTLEQAENAILPLTAAMSECEEALKAELRSLAQTEVLKIALQLKDLSPDVREQVMCLLSGQQQ